MNKYEMKIREGKTKVAIINYNEKTTIVASEGKHKLKSSDIWR